MLEFLTSKKLLDFQDSNFVLAMPVLMRELCQTKLQAVVDRGTGRGARMGRPCAGKTGTSDGHRDAWFAGFTPMLSCVVRVHHLLKLRLFNLYQSRPP